jgi:hypothetical protein
MQPKECLKRVSVFVERKGEEKKNGLLARGEECVRGQRNKKQTKGGKRCYLLFGSGTNREEERQ